MTRISTHVLDTSTGLPARGVEVTLEALTDGGWERAGSAKTDHDGRALLSEEGTGTSLGVFRLTFDTGGYHASLGVEAFFPTVSVAFRIEDTDRHTHVPLLLSPFGYATYRGS